MMKSILLKILLALVISNMSLVITKAQTWKELMDSTNIYYQKQDFGTALKWGKIALPEAEKEFGKLDTNYSAALCNLYELFYYTGNIDSAIYYCNLQLTLCRDLYKEENQDLVLSLDWMVFLYNYIGEYKKAEPFLIESLDILRRLHKTDHPETAKKINELAQFYYNTGDFKKAELLFDEALEMRRRLYKTDNPDLANSISWRAFYYQDRGDSKKAEPLYVEALDMMRRIYKTDNPDLAGSINSTALFYCETGNYKKAESLFIEALEMRRRLYKTDNPDLAQSIHNMGYFYNTTKFYDKAEPFAIEALAMMRRIYKYDNRDLALSISNLAVTYDGKGNYKKAENLFIETLEMSRRIYKKDHPSLIISITNLGGFYKDRGEYKKAEPLLTEAMEMSRRLYKDDHPLLALSINNMARLYNLEGNNTKAEPLYLEALDIFSKVISNYFPSLSDMEREKFWNKYEEHFETFNSFAIMRMKENQNILSRMFDNQLNTKAILYNSANKIRKRIFNSKDSTLISDFTKLTSIKEKLFKFYSLTKVEIRDKKINLDSIVDEANKLEKRISLKSEIYRQSYENKKIDWHSVQFALKPDEAAIEIVRFRHYEKNAWSGNIYYAALIVSDQTVNNPDIVLIENGKDLENLYYPAYRKSIKSKKADYDSFKFFWEKIYTKTKQYKRIYLSPDGIYNKLNISTLEFPDGKYMLERQDIQTLNSCKDLLLTFYTRQDESSVYNSAVLIGDPDYELDSNQLNDKEIDYLAERESNSKNLEFLKEMKLRELPGTEIEINHIEQLLSSKKWDVSIYLKADALKSRVKSVKNPRVLHIATHGFFLPDMVNDNGQKMDVNPLFQTGLFFAGASSKQTEGNQDAGFLTAYEAMNLDLDKTELVVLSACETGLGEIKNGEGVFGLRRAFQQAGARSVLMSLWKVNDEATQELMSTFYKEWVSGKTKRSAFNSAQKKIKDKYKHPYYWGAFVMVGE